MQKYLLTPLFVALALDAAPTPPSDLYLVSHSSSTVDLAWRDRSYDETGFKIYRDGDLIHTTTANITRYLDHGLLPHHRYKYTIKATNKNPEYQKGTHFTRTLKEYADDAEEDAHGSISLYSEDLDIVRAYDNQIVALRFQDIAIPRGAHITQAYIQFTADKTDSERSNFTIQAQASDDAPAFRYSSYDLSARSLTSKSVYWTPAAWYHTWERGERQRSSDISALLQEVVDRSGWRTNNAVALFIQGVGRRIAKSSDGDRSHGATLFVAYEEGRNIPQRPRQPSSSVETVKIAMIADQGTDETSKKVLRLIKKEDADMLLLAGDFDYYADEYRWEKMHRDILGRDFPILAVAGNHDIPNWWSYQQVIKRWQNNPLFDCEGEAGKLSSCDFKGIKIVMSTPNLFDYDSKTKSEQHIKRSLASDSSAWRICSFHETMRDMQTGNKSDETGWGVYEACRQGGAMIVTGHEHSYARSYLFNNVSSKSITRWSSPYTLEKGKSIVVVSGLGGKSARSLKHDGYWWAAKANASTGTRAGALFCSYRVDGDPRKARCYFKDIKGNVLDEFTLKSRVND